MPRGRGRQRSREAARDPYPRRGVNATAVAVDAGETEVVRLSAESATTSGPESGNVGFERNDGNVFSSLLRQQPQHNPTICTGQSSPESLPFSLPEGAISCADDDLTMHVPTDLVRKIWLGEYINFASLLKTGAQDSLGEQQFCINEEGRIVAKQKPSRKVGTIREWTDAFVIFMAIYLKKKPAAAQELLQYMSIIRDAESKCANTAWCAYDENFRMRQSNNLQPWGKINPDLWLRCMSFQQQSFGNPSNTSSTSNKTTSHANFQRSRGICLDFNNPKGCFYKNCKFVHKCLGCNKEHPEFKCFFRPNKRT